MHLSVDAPHIRDAAGARIQSDLEPAATSPGMVDIEATAAVYPADIAEASVLKQPLALAACDCPAVVEAGSNRDVDRDPLSRRGCDQGRAKAECKAKNQ